MLPTARLSALTESQRDAFDQLRQLCVDNDAFWAPSEAESTYGIAHDHDLTLLRYLRARSYDPHAAFQQYRASGSWRASKSVDAVFEDSYIEHFEQTRRLFPHWCGRRAKSGVPVFVYVVADVKNADLNSFVKRDPELTSIVLPAESTTAFDMPLCGALHPDGVVEQGVNIIDLSGVSLRQFWNLRNHLQSASRMATAHYPETVERMFIVGAPSYFPTVWGYITKWFDEAVTSKIHVLATNEVMSTLEQYIDRKDIPARFGGDLKWSFGQPPRLGEEFRPLIGSLMDHWTEGPLRFLGTANGGGVVALGSEGEGHKRRRVLGRKNSSSSSELEIMDEKFFEAVPFRNDVVVATV